MYQDNLSAIFLKNNDRLLSENQTKHIHVQYFLIKYIIVMGDLKVEYCLTLKILPGHFTKPLQKASFRKFRAEIQRILQENLDTYLRWYIPEDTFIPSQQEYVERSYVETDISIRDSHRELLRNTTSHRRVIPSYVQGREIPWNVASHGSITPCYVRQIMPIF